MHPHMHKRSLHTTTHHAGQEVIMLRMKEQKTWTVGEEREGQRFCVSPAEDVLVSGELEGVEADVAGGTAASEHGGGGEGTVVGDDLDGAEGEEDLPETASGDREEGLGGDGVVEAGEGELDLLLDKEAEGTEHADAAVLELGLAEPLEVKVVGEAEGVEANVAGHGAVKGRGAGEERHGVGLVLHLHACKQSDRQCSACGKRVEGGGAPRNESLKMMSDTNCSQSP
jgi:hypothetical protein